MFYNGFIKDKTLQIHLISVIRVSAFNFLMRLSCDAHQAASSYH